MESEVISIIPTPDKPATSSSERTRASTARMAVARELSTDSEIECENPDKELVPFFVNQSAFLSYVS